MNVKKEAEIESFFILNPLNETEHHSFCSKILISIKN